MKNRFFVKEKSLLLIAGIVWLMAGFNVARLGVLSYLQIERQWYLYLLSMLVFFLFGRMFFKMSKKHTKRIIAYEEYRPFWHFFDKNVNFSLMKSDEVVEGLKIVANFSLLFH